TEVPPEGVVTSGALAPPPAIPAAESTLGSHPCVALSSAQVLPEWINRNLAANDFASDGDYPLNFVSHSRGSLQMPPLSPHPLPGPLGVCDDVAYPDDAYNPACA